MGYLRLAALLLLAQALLFTHLVMITNPGGITGHVPATAGSVTEVNLQGTSPWGGTYGLLRTNASTTATIQGGTLQELNINHNNNTCAKTEIYASVVAPSLAAVQPVDPAIADTILGFDSNNAVSVNQMYDQQHTFNIQGSNVQLWATQTGSQLQTYLQGIGLMNGNIVFVVQAMNNGLAYNGEPANYQLLLPSGTWQLATDTSDSCNQIEEEQLLDLQEDETALRAALPQRVCVNEENTAYATYQFSRSYCSATEIGLPGCRRAEGITVRLLLDGNELRTQTTDETGSFEILPTQESKYTLELSDENQTSKTQFRARDCQDLDIGQPPRRENNVTGQPVNVELADYTFGELPEEQTPIDTAIIARTEMTVIVWLFFAITILMGLLYYQSEKDKSVMLLQLRIWMLQKIKK